MRICNLKHVHHVGICRVNLIYIIRSLSLSHLECCLNCLKQGSELRELQTNNAALPSQSTALVRAEAEASAVLPSNVSSTTIQRLDPDLVKSLVSTVTEEVTR